MNKYIITHEQIKDCNHKEQEFIISALYNDAKKMVEVTLNPPGQESILGNIYIGRVENIVSNIRAAFIKIAPDQTCYLSMDDLNNAFFTKKNSAKKELSIGDELLVQVEREALKTKEPAVTPNLNFVGKYAILTTADRKTGISSKLPKEQRAHYKEVLKKFDSGSYGMIVRTNAESVTDEILIDEIQSLEQEWFSLRENALHKTCFSILKKAKPTYLEDLKNQREGTVSEIITDCRDIFETIRTEYGAAEETHKYGGLIPSADDHALLNGNLTLTYYHDPMISLSALYSVKTSLERALRKQIWLNSGASLIIEHTEALTVIDVNTGKNIQKKSMREHLLRINLEAAKEIAEQLRLRNISGIIMIDFINMLSKEDDAVLQKEFRAYLKKDTVKADLIDMTKLGLVEVTRKKVKKSLYDVLKQFS